MTSIRFLGAAGTVTGSRFLVEGGSGRVLVDAGLFLGPKQSKGINHVEGPCLILSASGMATGGRVLHHLARRLPDPRTTVLLVGFQPAGTRGRALQSGAATVRIHGEDVPVKARVTAIGGFSAHADEDEISRWLATFPAPPVRSFLVHGEPAALAAARARMDRLGWPAHVPAHLEQVDL